MNKKNEKKISKSQEEIREEIKKLSEKAERITPKQLKLAELDDEDIRFDSSIFDNTADPQKSYSLYYSMMRLMKENLPTDKKLRRFIYDEKNIFLNSGKRIDEKTGTRGSDGRMAYIVPVLSVAFDITAEWVKNGANPFDLYLAFESKNKEMGYYSDSKNGKLPDELNPKKKK